MGHSVRLRVDVTVYQKGQSDPRLFGRREVWFDGELLSQDEEFLGASDEEGFRWARDGLRERADEMVRQIGEQQFDGRHFRPELRPRAKGPKGGPRLRVLRGEQV